MKLKANDIQKIVTFLQSKMKLRLLILYGSYASGHATEKSDIDLAFYADDDVDATTLFLEIAPELANLMHVESVDLVNLKEIDTVFRFIIVSTGQVIFQEGDFEEYLDRAYIMYLQLNDDRKEILKKWFGSMIKNDFILNKNVALIERLRRIRETYACGFVNFEMDHTRQDGAMLNIERAVQTSADIAVYILRLKNLEIPKTSGDAFFLLSKNKIISPDLQKKMQTLVKFRNTSVHEHEKLTIAVIVDLIEKQLVHFEQFMEEILKVS